MVPLLLLLAAAAGPDPSRLSSGRLAEAGDVARVKAAAWRPSDRRNGGRTVRFVAPGRMVLDWRTDGAVCDFVARRNGDAWALTVDCGSGPASARWTWLPGGGARTNVFLVAAPQMAEPFVELARFDRDFAAVERQFRADYRQRAVKKLAGVWKDASWETEVLLRGDGALLRGKPAEVNAVPCAPITGGDEVICVSLAADGERLMLAEQGERLYECEWDEGGDGAHFDLGHGSRIFARAQ